MKKSAGRDDRQKYDVYVAEIVYISLMWCMTRINYLTEIKQ